MHISLSTVLLLCVPIAAQQTLPTLAFEKAQKHVFDHKITTNLRMGPAGGDTEITMRCALEVIDTKDGAATLRITWARISGKTDIPFMTVRFDSEKEVESTFKKGNPLANRLARGIVADMQAPHLALQGFTYDVVVDRNGDILDLPGIDAKIATLQKKVRRAGNHKTVRALHSKEGLRWQVRMIVPKRPEGDVGLDAQWHTDEVNMIGSSGMAKVATKLHHRVRSIDEGKAMIEWSGTPRISSKKVEMGESSAAGSQVLSLADGLAIRGDIEFGVEFSYEKWHLSVTQDMWCEHKVVRVTGK